MKLTQTFFLTISALSSIAFSGKVEMEEEFKKLMNSTQNQRAIGDIFTGDFFDIISHYGCWCTLSSEDLNNGKHHPDSFYGKGKPVDYFDEVCKTLIQGYECAVMDAEASGESCKPWEVRYRKII